MLGPILSAWAPAVVRAEPAAHAVDVAEARAPGGARVDVEAELVVDVRAHVGAPEAEVAPPERRRRGHRARRPRQTTEGSADSTRVTARENWSHVDASSRRWRRPAGVSAYQRARRLFSVIAHRDAMRPRSSSRRSAG